MSPSRAMGAPSELHRERGLSLSGGVGRTRRRLWPSTGTSCLISELERLRSCATSTPAAANASVYWPCARERREGIKLARAPAVSGVSRGEGAGGVSPVGRGRAAHHADGSEPLRHARRLLGEVVVVPVPAHGACQPRPLAREFRPPPWLRRCGRPPTYWLLSSESLPGRMRNGCPARTQPRSGALTRQEWTDGPFLEAPRWPSDWPSSRLPGANQ